MVKFGLIPPFIGNLPIILNTDLVYILLIIKKQTMVIVMKIDGMSNISIDGMGSIARIIDAELTIFERMKIKKRSLKKLFGAIVFYLTTIIFFSICL